MDPALSLPSEARDRMIGELARVGVRGLVHATDIDTGHEIGIASDELVVLASVFKVPVLIELCAQYEEDMLAPSQPIRIAADEFRVDGGTGLSAMRDDVEISLRDLAFLMMSVSDNRATDVVVSKVGLAAVNARLRTFGLVETVVDLDCAGLSASIEEDLGFNMEHLFAILTTTGPDANLTECLKRMRSVTPVATNRTTPREITTLLGAIWRNEIIGPVAAAEVRRILGQQAWPHRLMSGFTDSRVRISGKTGSLFFVRNEVGVIEYPTGERIAVAVFLQEPTLEQRNPDADRVIGTVAAIAADYLCASQSLGANR